MIEGWDQADYATGPSPVIFVHARPYPSGYVVEVRDLASSEATQWAVEWAALPDDRNWTPHDLVEFAFRQILPRIQELAGDREVVIYFDCLRHDCDDPHVLTSRALKKVGKW